MIANSNTPQAFLYPEQPLSRRHQPADYADYRSYRPWLRDEFAFRCVYCLIREKWGRVTGEFDLDHFVPQIRTSDANVKYDNLLYACRTCNLRKGAGLMPDPSLSMLQSALRIYPDGTILGMTDETEALIRALCLNSPIWKRCRRMWIRIVELAAEFDPELLVELLGFPDDLPNLKNCRAPRNARSEGIEDSFYARRQRGELPEIFLR